MNKIFEQMNEELEEVCQNLDRLSDEKFLFDNPNYFERWQKTTTRRSPTAIVGVLIF